MFVIGGDGGGVNLLTSCLIHILYFYGLTALKRPDQRDIWDCLSSGKTQFQPEAWQLFPVWVIIVEIL